MPRIKNWKDLNFYKPSSKQIFKHIDSLFTKEKIIGKYLYDMIRVAQSIKAGKINPSTILKRLNTSSRKNKLYYAFRELGRVIRTTYLLNYLFDQDLRRIVQSSTNKCESFNKFVKWIYFGEDMITKNDREGQLRVINSRCSYILYAFH
jgi:TnpA family transposase